MPQVITTVVSIEERIVNIGNVSSRNLNSNNYRFTDKSRKGQEWSYCHLERYCHVRRVAERGVDKFKMCTNCHFVYYCNKSGQLKGWKQHKTVCDAVSQLKVDRKANASKTDIYNGTLSPSE